MTLHYWSQSVLSRFSHCLGHNNGGTHARTMGEFPQWCHIHRSIPSVTFAMHCLIGSNTILHLPFNLPRHIIEQLASKVINNGCNKKSETEEYILKWCGGMTALSCLESISWRLNRKAISSPPRQTEIVAILLQKALKAGCTSNSCLFTLREQSVSYALLPSKKVSKVGQSWTSPKYAGSKRYNGSP